MMRPRVSPSSTDAHRAALALSKPMTEPAPWRAVAALLADWGLIVLCFAWAILFPNPAGYVLAAVLIARTQLALAVLMHESAHGLLFDRRSVNDFVGQVFAAGPLMVSLPVYRHGHLKHHRAPMAKDDPVALVFQIDDYPISRRRLAFRIIRDLTGISYFVSAAKLIGGAHRGLMKEAREQSRNGGFVLASILATNGLMLGTLAAIGHPGLYLGLWVLPALTLLQAMGRVRAIMEHAGYPAVAAGEDQRQNARTIVRPSWQTFFFGPHAIHFHIEHHLNVRVPFHRLQQVHRAMAAEGLLPPQNLYRGYGAILREVTKA